MDVPFPATAAPAELGTGIGGLGRHIRLVHDRLRESAPAVSRLACTLYDPKDDLLKTFISSTVDGVSLHGYQYRLSDSESLSALARGATPRLLRDLPSVLQPTTAHSAFVLDEGYRSSFTVPMQYRDRFIGFVFFDSREDDTFTPALVRELVLHAGLITLAVANEMVAIGSVVGTIQLARDFTEMRDHETGGHIDRMARYARVIARDRAEHFGFTDETVEHVLLYAPMHDIGKIGIPDHVLLKPSALLPEEWEVMQQHTTKGARMVDSIIEDMGMVDLPDADMLRAIVLSHHERIDGSGYPQGLFGDDIPPAARIVAVADVFDALTSRRPYKPAWSTQEAFTELQDLADRNVLDAACVDALIAAHDEIEAVRKEHPDTAPAVHVDVEPPVTSSR